MTLLEFGLLFFTGSMDLFDSINHALTTMPSGGFSTHDASIGFYDSVLVEGIIIIFMFLAGVNFTLLWFIYAKVISREHLGMRNFATM